MNVKNLLPENFIENEYFDEMVYYLDRQILKERKIFLSSNYDDLPAYGDDVIAILTAGDEKGEPPLYWHKVGYVFKHQFDYDGHWKYPNVYHLPLTPMGGFRGGSEIPINDRKYDVSFVGSSTKRKDFIKHLNRISDNYSTKIIITGNKWAYNSENSINIDEYSSIIENSKIVLSPNGAVRNECLRFSEAVKCGCGILTPKYPDTWAFQKCPYTTVRNWKSINRKIQFTMKRIDIIHSMMRVCWRDYFSPKAAASRINLVVSRSATSSRITRLKQILSNMRA